MPQVRSLLLAVMAAVNEGERSLKSEAAARDGDQNKGRGGGLAPLCLADLSPSSLSRLALSLETLGPNIQPPSLKSGSPATGCWQALAAAVTSAAPRMALSPDLCDLVWVAARRAGRMGKRESALFRNHHQSDVASSRDEPQGSEGLRGDGEARHQLQLAGALCSAVADAGPEDVRDAGPEHVSRLSNGLAKLGSPVGKAAYDRLAGGLLYIPPPPTSLQLPSVVRLGLQELHFYSNIDEQPFSSLPSSDSNIRKAIPRPLAS